MEELKTVKDYTKYDFGAIVGAEVEMKVRDGKGSCWPVKGKVRLQDNGLVWVERSEGKPWNDCIIIREIISDSLTAKIKVEDMDVKQLKMHFKFDCDIHLVLNACEADTCKFVNGGVHHLIGPVPVSTVVDCTNWGWHKN